MDQQNSTNKKIANKFFTHIPDSDLGMEMKVTAKKGIRFYERSAETMLKQGELAHIFCHSS